MAHTPPASGNLSVCSKRIKQIHQVINGFVAPSFASSYAEQNVVRQSKIIQLFEEITTCQRINEHALPEWTGTTPSHVSIPPNQNGTMANGELVRQENV